MGHTDVNHNPAMPMLMAGLLLIAGLAGTPAIVNAAAAETVTPASASPAVPARLQTGQVRFALLLGDSLSALAIDPQPSTPGGRLLHAQALADLGLHGAARDALETLAEGGDTVASQAGLELVRLTLKAGETKQSQRWLDQTLPDLSGAQRQEGLFYQAELMRLRDELPAAAEVLGKMGGNSWTGIGYYNLAAAYAARDQSMSRPLVSLRVAAATVGDPLSPAGRELVDRSHLGGGILALQEQDYGKAEGFLAKVRLDSYEAPRALYLHGLARLKQNNVRGALQSWHRARKFPLAFPGASESYLAISQGFDQAGAPGQAAEAFLAARAAFDKERVVLDELAANVRQQGAYEAFWFLDNSQAVTAPRLAWLMRFMEDPQAQQTVQRLAELLRLDRHLEQKQVDLKVMTSSLTTRLKATGKHPQPASLEGQLETLRQRAEALQQRHARAVADNDLPALVSGELALRFRQLRLIETAAHHHADPVLLERVRRLQGVTLWEAEDSVDRKRAGLAKSVQELSQQVTGSEQQLAEAGRRADAAPATFQKYLVRVEEAGDRLDSQRQRIAALTATIERLLTTQVLAFIDVQNQHLESLEDRSEQEIAHLYEYMVLKRLNTVQSPQAKP